MADLHNNNFCDPNCSCDLPCLEARLAQEDGQQYEDDDFLDDDVCCFDPRYSGPSGSCHCAEMDEYMRMMDHWFLGRLHRFRHVYWSNLKRKATNPIYKAWSYFFDKRTCDWCEERTLERKWNNEHCPSCNEFNLPF